MPNMPSRSYSDISVSRDLFALARNLSHRRRIQLALLLGMMLASAAAEVFSLGAILPFLAILVDPQQALRTPLIAGVIELFGSKTENELRLDLAVTFALAALIAGFIRFLLNYVTAKLTYGIGHEWAAEIYRRSLHQSYEVQVRRNSSEVLGGLGKVDQIVYSLLSVLSLASSLLIAAFIVTALIFIDARLTLSALAGLGGVYAAVYLATRKKLVMSSRIVNEALDKRIRAIQEGLGAIRDILLDQSQAVHLRRFSSIDWPLRNALASIAIIGPSPRFAVEALGMVLIAGLAYASVSSGGSLVIAVPTFGALVLGMQRLLPLIQQVYVGCVQISGTQDVLRDVVLLLEKPIDEDISPLTIILPFESEIELKNVSYRYQPHLPYVLRNFNLRVCKGSRVGIVGSTGSGKSTAMDLLMGLLQPTEGMIYVDGRELDGTSRVAWQKNIAHVPQAIFLADASFSENIAFGIPREDIDQARVIRAAKQAQVATIIEASPLGYNEIVGERGVRLSGGQRQRIGIARALYKNAKLIIFDEATNALDSGTEASVIDAIEALGQDITILMIAHRTSTLKGCDMIIEISDGLLRHTSEANVAEAEPRSNR